MSGYVVKISTNLFSELRAYLDGSGDIENGCFLLGHVKANYFYVNDMIIPKDENWIETGEELCWPKSEYIAYAIGIAEKYKGALAFVHSHPSEYHPAGFSWIDSRSNKAMANNLQQILAVPIGSFVYNKGKIHGVIFNGNKCIDVIEYHILGAQYIKIPDAVNNNWIYKINEKEYDRQLSFIGHSTQILFRNLTISIIGCGGTGSPLAIQLAKMGVGRINLFDSDYVEVSNLPRIYGAGKRDVGKTKVFVVGRSIKETTNCDVKLFSEKIDFDHPELIKSDMIFGCVDNHTARDILNSIAYRYAIPYIDTACAIPLDISGKIEQLAVQMQSVTPDTPCLWCSGVLNPNTIREENLSKDERVQLKNDGYYMEITNQPSTISLTTNAATIAVFRFLNITGILSSSYTPRLVYDYHSGLFAPMSDIQNPACRCAKENPLRSFISHTS